MSTPADLPSTLRDIAAGPVLLECRTCLCAIMPGDAQTWDGETLCPACALDAVAPLCVEGLSYYEPQRPDLPRLIRASEILLNCAATLRASVDVARRREP